MPELWRKPRARRTGAAEAAFTDAEQMRAAVRAVAGDAEAWGALRPRVVAFILRSQHIRDAEAAGRIADAYFRKPHLIPAPPPRGYAASPEE